MSEVDCIQSLRDLLGPYALRVEELLDRWVPEPGVPEDLGKAMRYCVLDGGKRLRPALVFMTNEAVGTAGGDEELAERAAAAVELIHCYSLVHDDLPAMDDDDLRRGRPTAHVQFGQAMAILAGDALLTRAFSVLTECLMPKSCKLAFELAVAAGAAGMVAGQAGDMELCEVPKGREGLDFIHLRKTASLIVASVRMGAISANANEKQLRAVSNYGESIGLAFQLVDDLLDVTGKVELLGKTPGKDHASGKQTYVSVLGVDETRSIADTLTHQAMEAIAPLGAAGDKLGRLAKLLSERSH